MKVKVVVTPGYPGKGASWGTGTHRNPNLIVYIYKKNISNTDCITNCYKHFSEYSVLTQPTIGYAWWFASFKYTFLVNT